MTITSLNVDKLQQFESQQVEVYFLFIQMITGLIFTKGEGCLPQITSLSDAARYRRTFGLIT
jgi:hypothetical protein